MKSIEQLKRELQRHQELQDRFEREFREERARVQEERRRIIDSGGWRMEEEFRKRELEACHRYEEQQRRYEEEFRRIKVAIRREEEREYEVRIQQQNKDDCKIM